MEQLCIYKRCLKSEMKKNLCLLDVNITYKKNYSYNFMNEELNAGKIRSQNIKYNFMPELLENYDELKTK